MSFELLQAGRLKLSRNLLVFLTEVLKSRVHDEDVILTGKVNLAIALKHLKDRRGFAESLASEDWATKDEIYQLAEAVLSERYHDAIKLTKSVGNRIHKADYRNWPLFRDFRQRPEFQELFAEIFLEPLERDNHEEHMQVILTDQHLEEPKLLSSSVSEEGEPGDTLPLAPAQH